MVSFVRNCTLTSIEQSAPSRLPRPAIQRLLDASLKIANHLKYKGLGTIEYLVNTQTQDWVFLEINPRIQVEHTITGNQRFLVPFALSLICR